MKIAVLTACYNEAMILPYFLKHYSYVDQIRVLFETDTVDRSREILAATPNVLIKDIHIADGINDEEKVRLINSELKNMAEEFDWVYVLDTDEFIYPDNHEDPRDFLARQVDDIVYAHMWQVYRHWSDKDLDPAKFPLPQRQHGDPDLYSQVESQHRDKNANSIKPSVIRAEAAIELQPGNHRFLGNPNISPEIFRGVHWQMADEKIALSRRMARKRCISARNRELRHGFQHFNITPEIIARQCDDHINDPLLPIFDIPDLSFLKYISLEINDLCPLTKKHPECPRNYNRFAGLPDYGEITSDEMIAFARLCIDHGFDGLFTLHNYNEPMATPEIVVQMIAAFPGQVSLWTSGALLDPESTDDQFIISRCHDVMITRYPGVRIKDFSHFSNVNFQYHDLDNRAENPSEISDLPNGANIPRLRRTSLSRARIKENFSCTRPDWEIILTNRGWLNMCCADWKGEIKIGNIKTEDPHVLLHRWNQWRKKINNQEYPEPCLKCLARGNKIPMAGR